MPLEGMQREVQSVADAVWARAGRQVQGRRPVRVLFVGMEAGAGSTTIAAATAMSLARNHRSRIHLIETDVENPQLAGYLEIPNEPGLVDVLEGTASSEECLRPHPDCSELWVLPAGKARPSVPGELCTDSVIAFLERVSAHSRCVILDAPPMKGRRDSRALLEQVDYVVLVLAARKTSKSSVENALRLCEDFGVPVLGAVLNRYRSDLPFRLGERYSTRS